VIMLSEQLYRRPWQAFVQTLESYGCNAELSEDIGSEYPYRLQISPPDQILENIEVDCSLSSQFISGMMLVAPLMTEGMTLRFYQKPVSFDYLRLTSHLMKAFGIRCRINAELVLIPAGSHYQMPERFQIEPDMSSAAFFLAMGAFSEHGIKLQTLCDTRWQPDWRIFSILREMGVTVSDTGGGIIAQAHTLQGVSLDMESNPDLVPVLAILSLFAATRSSFRHIGRLNLKESDRLAGIFKAFDLIGAEYIYDKDCLEVIPLKCVPEAVTLDTQSDHRLMMAFGILKLHFPQIFLSEGNSVVKSCPEFYSELASLKH
jgi:3-phosphoshikimate 1-carboxyvinyltransferase